MSTVYIGRLVEVCQRQLPRVREECQPAFSGSSARLVQRDRADRESSAVAAILADIDTADSIRRQWECAARQQQPSRTRESLQQMHHRRRTAAAAHSELRDRWQDRVAEQVLERAVALGRERDLDRPQCGTSDWRDACGAECAGEALAGVQQQRQASQAREDDATAIVTAIVTATTTAAEERDAAPLAGHLERRHERCEPVQRRRRRVAADVARGHCERVLAGVVDNGDHESILWLLTVLSVPQAVSEGSETAVATNTSSYDVAQRSGGIKQLSRIHINSSTSVECGETEKNERTNSAYHSHDQ
ncbi:hypothetical protein GQ42DRAFT_181154 [Ramicandelaber brevisporus]|nr:hypothetical protein GQ42DRAFT_181154 [Ramicandelaber brevisporus]